ncbi:RNA polymerase sigma factor SigJ [Tundrisphaera sp. TA3]|uniref:RNA polymerase sigma factor SigJ n=1 Tax=Tundrisphaera sp. TA3 TaxID=3435775 RepID=UPI003EBFE9CB
MTDATRQTWDDALGMRPRLLALAYRMLGSVTDAEDAVQDAYLRFQQAGPIGSPEGWLVKATTRLCIDRLRTARRRRDYVGPWLPEPTTDAWDGATVDRAELAESLSMAFLVLMETLSPAERAAYLLRDVFQYEFDEIAALLDKTPVNVRQITTRARKRLEGQDRRFDAEAGEAEDLANRFFEACRSGDLRAIESMLAPDAVYYSDGGGKVHAAPKPLTGLHRIANLLSVVYRKARGKYDMARATVNGQPGIVFSAGGRPRLVTTLAAKQGQITALYTVLNPEKLHLWTTQPPDAAGEPAPVPS